MEEQGYKWYIIIFGLAVWILIRRGAGEYFVKKALLEVGVILLLIFAGEYAFWFFRYYMPHVTANGFCGSIGARPYVVGDYAIFPCGEVYEPFHLQGKLHTLVVPKKHVLRSGRNFISLIQVKKTPMIQLPEEVHRFLYHNQEKFNIAQIYYGEYTEEFRHENEVLPDFEEERANLRKQINMRNRIIEGDNDMLVEVMKTARELGQESGWRKFIPIKKKEEE